MPVQRLIKHNPRSLSDDQLEEAFVVRTAELRILAELVRATNQGEVNQHALVIGPRGMGKTMLIRRLALLIRSDKALNDSWYPIVTPESLVNRGVVVERGKQGRAKLYQVAERIYCIYYLMRLSGSEADRIRALVRFMVHWYGEDSLARSLTEAACSSDGRDRGRLVSQNLPEGIQQRVLAGHWDEAFDQMEPWIADEAFVETHLDDMLVLIIDAAANVARALVVAWLPPPAAISTPCPCSLPGQTRANRDTLTHRDIWLDDRSTYDCRRRLPLPPTSISPLFATATKGSRKNNFRFFPRLS